MTTFQCASGNRCKAPVAISGLHAFTFCPFVCLFVCCTVTVTMRVAVASCVLRKRHYHVGLDSRETGELSCCPHFTVHGSGAWNDSSRVYCVETVNEVKVSAHQIGRDTG